MKDPLKAITSDGSLSSSGGSLSSSAFCFLRSLELIKADKIQFLVRECLCEESSLKMKSGFASLLLFLGQIFRNWEMELEDFQVQV